MVHDIMDTNFWRPSPQQFLGVNDLHFLAAIGECLKKAVFVPVERLDGKKDHVTIEFDVEPRSSVCKNIVFFRQTEKTTGNSKKEYFFRQGTNSVLKTNLKELELLVHKRANWRAEEESGQNPSNIEQQLIQAICRGEQRINDTENTYNLITTRIDEMSHFPDWLPHVRWSSVFDFDPSAQLYRACKDGFIIPPKLLAIDDVSKAGPDKS